MAERNLPFSYAKRILYYKLIEGLDANTFTETDLINLLDSIEEFGNQHVYLYKCTPEYLQILKDPTLIQAQLRENNCEKLYNNKYSIIIPQEPMLYSVIHDDHTLKFKWVEKRIWRQLLEEKIEDDKYIEIHQINISRGVNTFRVNLVSGNAELMIQKLPKGTYYEKVKNNYLEKVSDFIEIHPFHQLGLRRAIRLIENSDEVENRQINLETPGGGNVTFKSKNRRSDYRDDPNMSCSREALGQNVSGKRGNFYWRPNHILKKSILTHIYSKDNRVGIFGQRLEPEVNYVLSRIRYFASI